MTDSTNTPKPRKVPQKPVFIIPSFDANNVEHMKGNVTLTLNKRLAVDLCNLIKECELDESEGYIYAMKGHLERWYKERYQKIKQIKEAQPVEVQPKLGD